MDKRDLQGRPRQYIVNFGEPDGLVKKYKVDRRFTNVTIYRQQTEREYFAFVEVENEVGVNDLAESSSIKIPKQSIGNSTCIKSLAVYMIILLKVKLSTHTRSGCSGSSM